MSIEEWSYDYHNKEFIDIRKELTTDELEIIKKLGIEILDKVYTEYDYDCLKGNLAEYIQDEDNEYETKSVEEKGVAREEFNSLIEKFDEIDGKEYNIKIKNRKKGENVIRRIL